MRWTSSTMALLALAVGAGALVAFAKPAANAPAAAAPSTAAALPQFTMFVYETRDDMAARSDPKRAEAYWAKYQAYFQPLQASGVMLSGSAVEPPEQGRSVTVRDGKTLSAGLSTKDGELRLGGCCVIQAKDLAAAEAIAAKCPAALSARVEVRPNVPMKTPAGAEGAPASAHGEPAAGSAGR